jgi:hypothetical protein
LRTSVAECPTPRRSVAFRFPIALVRTGYSERVVPHTVCDVVLGDGRRGRKVLAT